MFGGSSSFHDRTFHELITPSKCGPMVFTTKSRGSKSLSNIGTYPWWPWYEGQNSLASGHFLRADTKLLSLLPIPLNEIATCIMSFCLLLMI